LTHSLGFAPGGRTVGLLDPERNISQRVEHLKPYSCARHDHHAITSPPEPGAWATFADPAAAVREIVDWIGSAQYRLHWQYAVDGAPIPHSAETIPDVVAKCPNIHLFAERIAV